MDFRIQRVGEEDLPDLLPLLEDYLTFYGTSAPRMDLEALCRSLIADPPREGVQLIARDASSRAVGFATVYWTWHLFHSGALPLADDVANLLALAFGPGLALILLVLGRALPAAERPTAHPAGIAAKRGAAA